MSLAHRIIATLLFDGATLVKGEKFSPWRSIGGPQQAVNVFGARGIDELVFLDIAATAEGREPDYGLIDELTDGFFYPLAVGGGIRNTGHVKRLLRAGADKVVVGTAAYENRALIADIATGFGCQCVTVSVDVKDGEVWIGNGRGTIGRRPADYAREAQAIGAGEILLQSIDRDGTLTGYDLDLIRAVSGSVTIPVVASGGCSGYADMVAALEAGASAVAAGALWQFTAATPREAKEYLSARNWPVRL